MMIGNDQFPGKEMQPCVVKMNATDSERHATGKKMRPHVPGMRAFLSEMRACYSEMRCRIKKMCER